MNRYIVRVRATGDAALFGIKGGSPGAKAVVIRAENQADALRLGAAQMQRPQHTLEALAMEDAGTEVPIISPVNVEELHAKRGDTETGLYGDGKFTRSV